MPSPVINKPANQGIKYCSLSFLYSFCFMLNSFSQVTNEVTYVNVTPKGGNVFYKEGKNWVKFTVTIRLPETAWVRLEGSDGSYIVVKKTSCAYVKDTGNTQLNQVTFQDCNSNDFFKDYQDMKLEQEKSGAPISPKKLVYENRLQMFGKPMDTVPNSTKNYRSQDLAKVQEKDTAYRSTHNTKSVFYKLKETTQQIAEVGLAISFDWKQDALFDSVNIKENIKIARHLTDSLKCDSISNEGKTTKLQDELNQLEPIKLAMGPDLYFKTKASIYRSYFDFSSANQTYLDAMEFVAKPRSMLFIYRDFITYMRTLYKEKFEKK